MASCSGGGQNRVLLPIDVTSEEALSAASLRLEIVGATGGKIHGTYSVAHIGPADPYHLAFYLTPVSGALTVSAEATVESCVRGRAVVVVPAVAAGQPVPSLALMLAPVLGCGAEVGDGGGDAQADAGGGADGADGAGGSVVDGSSGAGGGSGAGGAGAGGSGVGGTGAGGAGTGGAAPGTGGAGTGGAVTGTGGAGTGTGGAGTGTGGAGTGGVVTGTGGVVAGTGGVVTGNGGVATGTGGEGTDGATTDGTGGD